MSDARQPEVDFLQYCGVILTKFSGQIISMREKTLKDTVVALRHIKMEKDFLPIRLMRIAHKRRCFNSLISDMTDLEAFNDSK